MCIANMSLQYFALCSKWAMSSVTFMYYEKWSPPKNDGGTHPQHKQLMTLLIHHDLFKTTERGLCYIGRSPAWVCIYTTTVSALAVTEILCELWPFLTQFRFHSHISDNKKNRIIYVKCFDLINYSFKQKVPVKAKCY